MESSFLRGESGLPFPVPLSLVPFVPALQLCGLPSPSGSFLCAPATHSPVKLNWNLQWCPGPCLVCSLWNKSSWWVLAGLSARGLKGTRQRDPSPPKVVVSFEVWCLVLAIGSPSRRNNIVGGPAALVRSGAEAMPGDPPLPGEGPWGPLKSSSFSCPEQFGGPFGHMFLCVTPGNNNRQTLKETKPHFWVPEHPLLGQDRLHYL